MKRRKNPSLGTKLLPSAIHARQRAAFELGIILDTLRALAERLGPAAAGATELEHAAASAALALAALQRSVARARLRRRMRLGASTP